MHVVDRWIELFELFLCIALLIESAYTLLLLGNHLQRMTPDDKNSPAGNPTSGMHANEDQNPTSANAQDQTLLKALQDLIVRAMDPMPMTHRNEIHLGPEARKLIIALQEFISSIIVRSQSGGQTTVEVSLDEEGELHGSGEDNLSAKTTQLPAISSSESQENAAGNADSGELDISGKPQPTFDEKLLRAFREHVFNKMPIRVLFFEPHGSSLQIVLLKRGALFGRIASMVKGRMDENEFRPSEQWQGKVETEEEAIERLVSKYAGYAILSHTWLRTAPGEVTYGDWNRSLFSPRDPGYRKLVNFCKAAWKDHRLSFGWMDTVCINKESSSELDESIRSMYDWYSRAAVCITYLGDTQTLPNMYLDPWFTRGWTLQELLAPHVIKFYNSCWKRLVDLAENDREDTEIMNQIEQATTISKAEFDDIHEVPISRRMQLAATREVTREEDTAYSLMGIFDVSISTAYGEGAPRAFFRLLQAILISSKNILDILNWAGKLPSPSRYNSTVLPPSPQYYASRSSNASLRFLPPTEPLTLTHMGLRVPVILMPAISISETSSKRFSFGDYYATLDNHSTKFFDDGSAIPTAYNVLDYRTSFGDDGWTTDRTWYQLTFAVFNFIAVPNTIFLPKTRIAIPLKCIAIDGEVWDRGRHTPIQTSEPIVFELGNSNSTNPTTEAARFFQVKPDDLAKHGMRMLNLYL